MFPRFSIDFPRLLAEFLTKPLQHFASLPTVLLYRLQQSLQGSRAQRWSDQGIARREDPAAVHDVQDELNGFTSVLPRFNGIQRYIMVIYSIYGIIIYSIYGKNLENCLSMDWFCWEKRPTGKSTEYS